MTRDEIVEVMARELTGFLGSNCCHRSGGQPGPNRRSDCDCVIAASAAFAALEARGIKLVGADDYRPRVVNFPLAGCREIVLEDVATITKEIGFVPVDEMVRTEEPHDTIGFRVHYYAARPEQE